MGLLAGVGYCRKGFTATAPNQLWVVDITQHRTDEGWLCFSSVIDVFSRMVEGWSMGDRPVADLVLDALNMAVWNPATCPRPATLLFPWSVFPGKKKKPPGKSNGKTKPTAI